MKGIKLGAREKKIAYVLITIVVLFIVERFFISPLITKIKVLNQQVKLEEAKLKFAVGMKKDKDLIAKECKQYESFLKVSEENSGQEVITAFLNEIEKIAAESQISVISLSPQTQSEDRKDAKGYKADLRAEATPYRIFDFMQKIESSSLLVGLHKLTIAPKDEAATILRLDTAISIIVPTK